MLVRFLMAATAARAGSGGAGAHAPGTVSAAALSGADDATKAAIATTLGGDASYKRFDYRVVDVMGSGRYFYASSPKGASLPH